MLLATPGNLPIEFSQGDQVTLTLIATDDQGNPINLTGATFSTQVLGPNGSGVTTFGNSQHTANADQVNYEGYFTLALADTDTPNCGLGANKEIITTITLSAVQQNYRGVGLLTVYPSAPSQ